MDKDSYILDHIPVRPVTFKGYRIISDQITSHKLSVIWQILDKVMEQQTNGDIVEFGCYVGTTSLFIRRLINRYDESGGRSFHVYDSFAGLPGKSPVDQNAAGIDFQEGKLYASKKELLRQFHIAALRPPIIHKAWFCDLGKTELPGQIAFAFLDGDFYNSIIDSLGLVWPRLQIGGKILIDDYQHEALPGVNAAVKDFFQDKPAVNIYQSAGIGIISK